MIKAKTFIIKVKSEFEENNLSKTEKTVMNNWIDFIGLNIPKYQTSKGYFGK